MAKGKTPDLPAAPTFYEDPRFKTGLEDIFGLGRRLTSFDFTGGLAPLQDVISTSPETTQMFLQGLQAQLAPQRRDLRQQLINEMAATGQTMGSAFGSRLGQMETDYQSALLAQSTQFGLADTARALENRLRLFGMGLGTTERGVGFAGEFQGLRNQFNLQNYQNLVAKAMMEQGDEKGGLFGGLMGGAGGAIAGLALAPLTGGSSLMLAGLGGLAGGAAGAMGPAGTGGQLFSSGAGLLGSSLQGGLRTSPGMAATSDPFAFKDVGLKSTFASRYGAGGWGGLS